MKSSTVRSIPSRILAVVAVLLLAAPFNAPSAGDPRPPGRLRAAAAGGLVLLGGAP